MRGVGLERNPTPEALDPTPGGLDQALGGCRVGAKRCRVGVGLERNPTPFDVGEGVRKTPVTRSSSVGCVGLKQNYALRARARAHARCKTNGPTLHTLHPGACG